jgi:deoxyribose-phosphate aldolase
MKDAVSMETAIDRELASVIDHTLLKPDARETEVAALCEEALAFGFASVCVSPSWVRNAADRLPGSAVKVCTVIGFPLGTATTANKSAETRDAFDCGAVEFDMVLHAGKLKDGDLAYVGRDIERVAEAAKKCDAGNLVKVILETCFLDDDEKAAACRLAKSAGADFVKTSTGFGTAGATERDVALMRSVVGHDFGVKASGGIRTADAARAMLRSGATRLGTSSSVSIVTIQEEQQSRRK